MRTIKSRILTSLRQSVYRIFRFFGFEEIGLKIYVFLRNEFNKIYFKSRIKNNYFNVGEFSEAKKVFVDITSLVLKDHGGGIQRVQKKLVSSWLESPPEKYNIIPIFFDTNSKKMKYVDVGFFGIKPTRSSKHSDDVIMSPSDIYFNTDLNYQFVLENEIFFSHLKEEKIRLFTLIYDLLPITMPQNFPDEIETLHKNWLQTMLKYSEFLCISKTVMDEFRAWSNLINLSPNLNYIHLGSDVMNITKPQHKNSKDHKLLINEKKFLIVSTLEPRKGHDQVLEAFDIIWDAGLTPNLVFVGKKGWKVDELVSRIKNHKYFNKYLFWFDNLSDFQVVEIYQESTALINASYGEGFGLPIVEASHFGLPLILRELPIFREIAGNEAWYFTAKTPNELSDSLLKWIKNYDIGNITSPVSLKTYQWEETCHEIISIFEKTRNRNANEI